VLETTAQSEYERRSAKLANWERRTEWPLTTGALLFLLAYAIRIIIPQQTFIPRAVENWILGVTWVGFAVDYVVRLVISPDRWIFVRKNLLDLVTIVLPVARPLRLLRAFTALEVLNRIGYQTLRGRLLLQVTFSSALLLFVSGLAVTEAERGVPGATITNFGTGVWWAAVTMSMVGYGDITPQTLVGRVIAVVLMIAGMIVVGVIAGTLSSWFIAQMSSDHGASELPATREHIDALSAEIKELRAELHATRAQQGANPAELASDP